MERSLFQDFMVMLPENPTNLEIEKAYKLLAQMYHPDQNPNRIDWANEKMKQLNAAKELLLDPNKKTKYLNELKNQKAYEKEQLGKASKIQKENLALKHTVGTLQKRNEATGMAAALLLLLGAAMAFKD